MKAKKPGAITPLFQPAPAVPVAVSLKWAVSWTQNQISMARLRCALADDEGAPLPICGDPQGGRYLFNGAEMVAWLHKISQPGCWPKPQKVAA